MGRPKSPERLSLPPRPFLYTIDQIAALLSLDKRQQVRHIYFEGRTQGFHDKHLMLARNIELDPSVKPDWRIAESELVRWLRFRGFMYYDRGTVKQ